MATILMTIVFSIVASIMLFFVENRSNLPSVLIIPVLVSLLTKYVLGDWDKGFQWSLSDIAYWASIFGTSYATIHVLDYQTAKHLHA